MERLTNELIANGFTYFTTSESVVTVRSDNTLTGYVKLLDDGRVEVNCTNSSYKVTEIMAPEAVPKWIREQSYAPVKQALNRVGIENLCDWSIHKKDDVYTVSKKYYGKPPANPEIYPCRTLETAASIIAEHTDGGDLMRTQAVQCFIRELGGFMEKDSWRVSIVDPRYRLKLEVCVGYDYQYIMLSVDLAGTIVQSAHRREVLTQMHEHSSMVTLRAILDVTEKYNRANKWARERMDKTSNYVKICAALAAIGYVRKTDSECPGEDIFESNVIAGACVIIKVADKYTVSLGVFRGVLDDYDVFPLGTSPEKIIEWIYKQQPWLKKIIELQTALESKPQVDGESLAAARAEAEVAKAKLEKIRAAVE